MNYYKKRLKAFTLLECLVALLTIAMSALVIQGMTQLINQDLKIMRNSDEKTWQNFCNLLRRELENTEFDRVENDFLYVKTSSASLRFGNISGADDFRKTNEKGQGYQPMIYDVSSASISNNNKVVTIQLTFNKGGKKTFIYAFSKDKHVAE
ncbi:competence protein ComGF [Lactococcus hodotermopsidis]|uniref:Competence protein ComGF n=1 Tax=Pseudolactococcus hodotermopsidis TaxID=2709157 RepID=A0A6A0BAK3_9LACT|nr:competence type IV pilus minor pilin ComGF [Lactococcus hodotermopsidis]GFH42459.1 competence protein ComGF [Lactococcus hodotermopsidis]